jgi:serine carboxypeptidase-like clade 1
VYNILEACYHEPQVEGNKSSKLPLSFQNLGKTERPLPVRKRMFGRAWPFRAPVRDGPVTLWPQLMADNLKHVPCVVSFSSTNSFLTYSLYSVIHKWSTLDHLMKWSILKFAIYIYICTLTTCANAR